MLQTAGLWKRDFQTGQEGYTLAAALLFGKDEVIQQIVPHYKTDALVRKADLNRYDDREYIQTNLIEAYEKLMDFVAKHLPDKFYAIGVQRVSLRAFIFREVVANLIVHREFTNAHPATFIIYKNRVETENANNPHGEGPIDPLSFAPFPKNPAISKFFIQLGRVEELGSGILNVNRYIKEFGGNGATDFIEGATFKMHIPVPDDGINDGVNDGVKIEIVKVVKAIITAPGSNANTIATAVKKSKPTVERYLKIAREVGLINFKGIPKTGGYELRNKLKERLQHEQQ